MRLIRAAQHRVMPWKNGQGSTTEIAVSPPGAGLEAFAWRISMAAVAADGPFSVFDGIDRSLSVLEGAGIRLMVEGRAPRDLTADSEPCAFPGDAPTRAELLGGPITDFNVMTRRGRLRHAVRRIRLEGATDLATQADEAVLFCQAGVVRLTSAEGEADLGPHDAVLSSSPSATPWRVSAASPSTLFWVELFSLQPSA